MVKIDDSLYDSLLSGLASANQFHLLSQEPTSYANVATYTLGNKANPSIGAATDATPNGRKRTIAAITDGAGTATGTATHWAIVDTTTSKLIATNALTSSKAIASGNVFTTTAIDITVKDAVSA